MNFSFRYLILLSLIFLVGGSAAAQREKNNIYLFDCTGSMKKASLWEPAKEALDATIKTQCAIPATTFTIIPFGDSPYETITFGTDNYSTQQKAINTAFEKYIQQAKFTHITDVLESGFAKTDTRKDNRIYLLTDGMPNGGDTPEKVADAIRRWCAGHKNCRLFYVALTTNVVNSVIADAIAECPDAFIVQCEGSVIPQIADVSSTVYTNIEELSEPREVSFSLPGTYQITVESEDSLFDVAVKGGQASGGKLSLSLSPRGGQSVDQLHSLLKGEEYAFNAVLRCTDKRYFIANPSVRIHVSDEVPSELQLCGAQEETEADGVRWHDSFLWSGSADDESIVWDLSPTFRHQLPQSSATLRLESAEGQPDDFSAWLNGEPLKAGEAFEVRPGTPAVIRLQFDHSAKTGKRYFTVTPTSVRDIDMINGSPADEYQGSILRTRYSVSWNPLKTILFWIAIAIIALLVLWFVILKRIFFPTIKMSRVEIVGPDSYYLSKKIKGARRIILTSRRKNQSILSRLFTGEVRFIRADHFTDDLIMEAAAGKKKVKVRSTDAPPRGWDVYPSAIFMQDDKGTITNRTTRQKSDIEFS